MAGRQADPRLLGVSSDVGEACQCGVGRTPVMPCSTHDESRFYSGLAHTRMKVRSATRSVRGFAGGASLFSNLAPRRNPDCSAVMDRVLWTRIIRAVIRVGNRASNEGTMDRSCGHIAWRKSGRPMADFQWNTKSCLATFTVMATHPPSRNRPKAEDGQG